VPVTVRLYRAEDAQSIAALYNRHPDSPNPVAGGITAQDFERELTDRGTAAFFVAVDDSDEVVGTFGLFRATGRRCAGPGELIADMLFVVPAQRNGMLTGQIFARAITWMFEARHLVLRLTVNPANRAAFHLYRRVGCLSVGVPRPGEDGNVELYNYIPLILIAVLPGLGEEFLVRLRRVKSFACLTEDRGETLGSDLVMRQGVRTASYRLVLDDLLLSADIAVDTGTVTWAKLQYKDGTIRDLQITPRVLEPARPDPRTYRFGTPELSGEVDGADGTVRLLTPAHLGPVLTSTWPSCHPDRVAGWRDPYPCDLHITPVSDGVRVVERHGSTELVGTITLVGGRLRQEFVSTAPVGRVFHAIGLRQGTLRLRGAEGTEVHPIGLGLGVRDASEIVAAAHRPPVGSELTWTSADESVQVTVPVSAATGLVHARMLDRRPEPGLETAVRFDTHVRVSTPRQDGDRPRVTGHDVTGHDVRSADGTRHEVRLTPRAGGVTNWTCDGTRVLRSPYPHRRPLVCNPTWAAGMWVTTEHNRYDRGTGVGWGLMPRVTWEPKHPLGIHCPELRIGWELSLPEAAGPGAPVTVDLHHPDARGEVALWLTPHTARGARVRVPAPEGTWEHSTEQTWQCWAPQVWVELADGRWLDCRPGPDAPADAELVVRSTPAGLLVGCLVQALPPHGTGTPRTSSTWAFRVVDDPAAPVPLAGPPPVT